ncbi:MAG TPA: 2OG-Fe(II) oxygenase [Flavobacteriales bacterium]|nr:2OG-Fe(II) oxygenase [Flavobacteriales bacterium]HPH81858.1 2OG-Fe(II) oxygenase [Flavobacteriales bacterium]
MSSIIPSAFFEPSNLQALRNQFDAGKPFRHLVIDNFLDPEFANTLYENFPGFDLMSRNYHGLNEHKSEGSGFENFHPAFNQLRAELNKPEFYKTLSTITGIDNLYSVEDALGMGVHQGGKDSYLDVHIDFNIHTARNIHRRCNLLIFLNKNWQESYGGHVELWNKDVSKLEQKVLPILNRCVIFETNEISYHGYSKINVPEGETRKSFYSYFYTDLREDAARFHDTVFKARPEEGIIKKVKTDVKETLKNTIKRNLKKVGINI